MIRNKCKNIIFSSSASVDGNPDTMPILETFPKGICINPYGKTKSLLEEILIGMFTADIKNNEENPWNIVLL